MPAPRSVSHGLPGVRYASGPSADMPNSQTMRRAISVARSMSLPAPLVIWRRKSSSATRPPMRMAICASRNSRVCVCRSPSGNCIVTPSARPRGMIVTLCSGSAPGRRAARNLSQVHIGIERDLLAVNAKNLLASVDVGRADGHLTVEASGTQQRRIENVRAVGRRDDDDALIGREAVHLDEQLIERLLALFMTQRIAAAGAADG